jgi:hypothetical protein
MPEVTTQAAVEDAHHVIRGSSFHFEIGDVSEVQALLPEIAERDLIELERG